MIIKKFQANTEIEAIKLAKADLGKDAMVMNIKTISPRGIYKLFRKKIVEITAVIDDNNISKDEHFYEGYQEKNNVVKKNIGSSNDSSTIINETSAIEQRLNDLQILLESQMEFNKKELKEEKKETIKKQNEYIQLIYNQLLNNEVDSKYANQIVTEIEDSINQDATVDKVIAAIYQKIVLKLGQPKTIEFIENAPKVVFFIGPTGVGKTTTIAKIASTLKINQKAKIALLTSDTYRIAAVEQLRIYANILNIPLKVVYTEEEIKQAQKEFYDYDVILVDTAGRSHKNKEQNRDLKVLLNSVSEDDKEIYLVLSATTKNIDLERIVEAYSDIDNFNLIFTKLDETINVGNILNVKLATNASLSYATWGQNVPDDIGKIDIQSTAKQLLGGNDLWTRLNN